MPARFYGNKSGAQLLFGVGSQDTPKFLMSGFECCGWDTEINYTGTNVMQKDESSEVPIPCYQYPLLSASGVKDIGIRCLGQAEH